MIVSSVIVLAIIGFCLSAYAYYLEYKVLGDPSYKPACDLNDRISCTKPIRSAYGKLLGISNSILGMAFYTAIIGLALTHQPHVVQILTLGGLAGTIVFAYVLYFKIKSLCLVCTSLYIVNILLFMVTHFKLI
jgi:vitamin-K-epoxide reductase (warfarin-sensitive)